jgi:hypothetical protein
MGALINSGIGAYESTSQAVKSTFELRHNNIPIFERYFNGQDPNVVGIGSSLSRILLPSHNFVSGEEVAYDYEFDFTHLPIQIAPTNIPGIGITNILPNKLFVIKENELYIRFAATPQDATVEDPVPIIISSVGIGTLHKIYSKNVDSRVLITVDNIIQSPIVGTGVTVSVTSNVTSITDVIDLSSSTNLYNGDLIKINDEIMKIRTVGFTTSTNILVKRPYMGTNLGIHSIGDTVEKLSGNYTISGNEINFASAPYGAIPVSSPSNKPDDRDYSGITTSSKFSGRCFIRSAIPGDQYGAYYDNYVFDDISEGFTGVTTDFYLKIKNQDVANFALDAAMVLVRGVFQSPKVVTNVTNTGNYKIAAGINSTNLNFTGLTTFYDNDVSSSGVPIGGVISSVGSSEGFGYQKLKQAVASPTISIGGTILSIQMIDGGSGYRPTTQPVINVYAKNGLLETEEKILVGYANVGSSIEEKGKVISVTITNPGSEYTLQDAPDIIIDAPLNYTNIPLIYSTSSQTGVGTGAKIDIIVGQGSSIVDFEVKEYGYGYKPGDVLTIPLGDQNGGLEGLIDYIYNILSSSQVFVGIVSTFIGPVAIENGVTIDLDDATVLTIGDNQYQSIVSEFQVYVDSVYRDQFSAWSFGELEVFDSPENLFNNVRKTFPLTIDGIPKAIIGDVSFDVQAALLVFLNGVLQIPGEGYIFDGGSTILFTEPPNGPLPGTKDTGDNCQILFYKGTKDVDVVNIDILDTVKVGDTMQLIGETVGLIEDERIIHTIDSASSVVTNVYSGVGVITDVNIKRPLQWCKQTEDLFIDGREITKDRPLYEPIINPVSNIIANVGVSLSTSIYVESGKTLFDNNREDITKSVFSTIEIIDQSPVSRARANITISNGNVSSIEIVSNGYGYKNAPAISISSPIGIGSTGRATATSFINNVGILTGIFVINPGFGYTSVPEIIIEQPTNPIEKINDVSYIGDYGIITGVAATVVGVATTALVFSLYIPEESTLRDKASTGIAITVSQLQHGDYFTVKNTYVGNGIISVDVDGKEIGFSTSYIDNIYQVYDVNYVKTEFAFLGISTITGTQIYNSPGLVNIGVTVVIDNNSTIIIDDFSRTDVTVGVARLYPEIIGLPPSLTSYGDYSWCKIDAPRRPSAKSFISYNTKGFIGIETSPLVRRFKPLNSINYIS